METIKGLFGPVVDATIRAFYVTAKEEQSNELYYQDFGLNEYEPDVPEEVLQDMSGFGRAVLSSEGQEYGMVSRVNGYPVTLKMRKYTAKFIITEEDIHWINKSSGSKRLTDLKNAVSDFEASMNQRWNEDACKVFYLGFGTTFLSVGNSEALFGVHTLKSGDTTGNRNIFTTTDGHLALSPDALVKAINIMNRARAHSGIQYKKVRDLRLIIATENASVAYQTIDSVYGPTTNLSLSVGSQGALQRRGMNIKVVEGMDIPYAYRTYWFLTEGNRAAKKAFLAFAWKPRMNQEVEYNNGTTVVTGSTVFGPVILGWQWAFGSKGDASVINA